MNLSSFVLKHGLAVTTPRRVWTRVQSSVLGRRLANGAVWSLVGTATNRGLYLIVSVLAARMLGKQAYGQFSFIQSTAGMVALFAGFGLGLASAKNVAEFRTKNRPRAGRIIALSAIWTVLTAGIGAGVMVILAPWFAHHTLFEPGFVELFRISALMVFCGAVTGAQAGILTGFEAFRAAALVNCASGVLMVVSMVLGIQAGGAKGAVWGVGISMMLSAILNVVVIRHEALRADIPVRFFGCLQEVRLVWNFGLPIVLAAALVTPVYWFGQAVLAKNFGFAAQAEYSIGAQWRTAAAWLPVMLTSAFLPVLSSLSPEQKTARRRLVVSGLALSGGVALLAAITIGVLAELILHAYGKTYLTGAWVVRVLALAAVFDAVNDLLNQSILAEGRAWLRLWANTAWAILTVAGIAVIVPRQGAIGLAVVLCFTQALHLLIQLVLYQLIAFRHCAQPNSNQ